MGTLTGVILMYREYVLLLDYQLLFMLYRQHFNILGELIQKHYFIHSWLLNIYHIVLVELDLKLCMKHHYIQSNL